MIYWKATVTDELDCQIAKQIDVPTVYHGFLDETYFPDWEGAIRDEIGVYWKEQLEKRLPAEMLEYYLGELCLQVERITRIDYDNYVASEN